MQLKINGEQPFQVLSTNFTIGPSESGYDLYFSADGISGYSKLFTVGANTNRQVTQVAAGSYYILSGNTDEVTVNWIKECGGQGGGGGSYVLPTASETTLGGVKIGSGITIDENGAISAEGGGSYILPTASENVLGGVKIGSGITIDENGAISAEGGGANDYYVGWDDLFDMDYGPRRAAFAEIVEKYNAGYHIYASGTTAASNGYDVILPLVEFIPGTWSTDRYNGGWAKFGGICASGETSGYYGATFSSSGNIDPNARYFSKTDFYTLKNATVSRLGGVIVGSGLTMDGSDKLSVNIGDGLAFSGNTIVVSGGTGGQVFYIDNIYGTYQDLATLLFSYWDNNNSIMSSAYPADDIHIYMWMGQDFQGAFSVPVKGYIELFPDSVYEEDGIKIMKLTGVYVSDNTAYTFKYGLCEDGSSRGNWTEQVFSFNFGNYISYCRFGNDGRGYLTYDADNDRFEYDSAYVATGDTSNACPDLVDWLLTKQGLVDGGLIFDYICVQNLNKLFVTENGETNTYTHPTIGFKALASPYTIGDYTFDYEITYKYTDWELKIDMSDGNNVGANLRIAQA